MATNEEILASITSLSGEVSGLYDVTRILSNNDATLNDNINNTRESIVDLGTKVSQSFTATDTNISNVLNEVDGVKSSIDQARMELASKDVKFDELAAYLAEVRFDIAEQRESLDLTFGALDTKLTGQFDALTAQVNETTQSTLDLVTEQNQTLASGLDFLTQSSATAFEGLGAQVQGLDANLTLSLDRVESKIDGSVEAIGNKVDRNLAKIDNIAGQVEVNLARLEELDGSNERRYEKLAGKTDGLLERMESRFDKVDNIVSNGFERLEVKTDNLLERISVNFAALGEDISQGFTDVKSTVVGRIDSLQDVIEGQYSFMMNRLNVGFGEIEQRDAVLDSKADQLLAYSEVLDAKSDVLLEMNTTLIERSDALSAQLDEGLSQASEDRVATTAYLTDQITGSTDFLSNSISESATSIQDRIDSSVTSLENSINNSTNTLERTINSGFQETNDNISNEFTLLTREIEYQFIDLNDSVDSQFQGTLDSISSSTDSITNSIDSATTEIITSLSPGNSLFGQSQGRGSGR